MPVARNVNGAAGSPAAGLPSIRTVWNVNFASAIWQATVRFQMRAYSFASAPARPNSFAVFIAVPAGRIASWASCAPFDLPLNLRGDGER